MQDLLETARQNSARAWEVIRELQIMEHWASAGARVNVVGSLRIGLQINNLDIDLHIYSDPFVVASSFQAVGLIASNPRVRSVSYQSLEWHANYVSSTGEPWRIDMIHIHPESRYVGFFEDVADRIQGVLTPETRYAILAIKNAVPTGQKVMGIRVYQAVIRDGVRTYAEFVDWEAQNPSDGIITWVP